MTGLYDDAAYTLPPDNINSVGTKFWFDNALTNYARSDTPMGLKLDGIVCLIARYTDGSLSRLITKNNGVLFEDPSFMRIAEILDRMRNNPEPPVIQSADSCVQDGKETKS